MISEKIIVEVSVTKVSRAHPDAPNSIKCSIASTKA